MQKWTDILSGFGGSAKRLAETLARMEADRTVVRLQIEGSHTRFKSRLILKDNQVVFAKPAAIQEILRAGSIVRFKMPGDPKHEIRLEVFAPHVNLASGNAVFMCRPPASGLAASNRQTDRYGVKHLSNVRLVIPHRAREFRLADISTRGCAIITNLIEAQTYFPLDKPMTGVHIQAGSKAQIDLESVIPRSHHQNSVGCEFQVKQEGTSQTYLSHLINSLDRAEAERLKV